MYPLYHNQKGAFFGLDARIALAIFAALSVIVGYVGISRITTARHAAFLKELLAYEDAIMQIQTDVGVFYQFAISGSDGVKDFNAIEDGATNLLPRYLPRWNGPYIDGIRRNHPEYGTYTVEYHRDNFSAPCTISNTCYVWLVIDAVPTEVFDFVNRQIDEDAGLNPEAAPTNQGRIRANGTSNPRELRFRTNALRFAG